MQTGVQVQNTKERPAPRAGISFLTKLGGAGLRSFGIDTLQVNVGKLCNQACKHCHVDASPRRTEIMLQSVVDACLTVLREFKIPTLDITGGAPELIPDFRRFVTEASDVGAKVIVRHNLTVMFEPGQDDLPEFFAANRVEIVSSLPYFNAAKTDSQRGKGVFDKSIAAIKRLNAAGFGVNGGLTLDLVYNPVGAYLPPDQKAIEADFKRELFDRYGITFTNLLTITNMPIARFLHWLQRSGNETHYMSKLVAAFNPATIDGLMCRRLISVDWTGRLYDCDFNQMLDMPLEAGRPQTLFDFRPDALVGRKVMAADHCFGCTAGSGSSCGGAVAA